MKDIAANIVATRQSRSGSSTHDLDAQAARLGPHWYAGLVRELVFAIDVRALNLDEKVSGKTLRATAMRGAGPAKTEPGAADAAMSRYADGDEEMFAVVYDTVAPRLEAYLQRNLRNQTLVDDIVQQTFMQMHAKRGTFERGAQVLPWAFCIARNFMVDALRRSRHEGPVETAAAEDPAATWLVSAVATADQIIEARQTEQRIVAVFAGLTDHQRAAFELTKGDGLSQSDAAQILGTTVMGIKQCVHKVHKKLQRALEDDRREAARPESGPTTSVGMGRR